MAILKSLPGGAAMTLDEMYMQLTEENKEYINCLVADLIEKQSASAQTPGSQE